MSRLNIRTGEKRFPVAPDLYGLFFEDISRAGDGGLYPEMLRNRSFEDSLLPEGCVTNDGGRTATCTVTVKKPIQQKALTKTGGNGTVVLALGDQLQLSADFATNRGWQLKGVKTSKAKVAKVCHSVSSLLAHAAATRAS